jgi:hypothetical protein
MIASAQTSAPKKTFAHQLVGIAAALIFLGTVGFWALKGAHTGWSQNQVPIKQTDEITGIEFVTYEKRFVPGVEFLGAGVGFAAGLFVVSLLFKRKNNNSNS